MDEERPAPADPADEAPDERVPESADAPDDGLALHSLQPRLMPYWILVNLITSTLLAAGIIAGAIYLRGRDAEHAPYYDAAAITLVAALLLLALVQPVLAWWTWRYGMDDELLVMRYGILFREEKTIPISRLQHVDLRRGPIERAFSLATLVVFTAGTEGATFRVPGLSVHDARGMRDVILARRGDDVI